MSPETATARTFAVFLRGINVGGVRIAMQELQRVLVEAGFAEVRTLLASGNVVLSSPIANAVEVKARVESALREAFGYEAWVIVKSARQVARIVEGYPFDRAGDGGVRHAYAVLTTGPEVVDELVASCPTPSPEERFQASGDLLYWEVPKGKSLDTKLARQLARGRYKALVTTRNLNTMEKVLESLGESERPAARRRK